MQPFDPSRPHILPQPPSSTTPVPPANVARKVLSLQKPSPPTTTTLTTLSMPTSSSSFLGLAEAVLLNPINEIHGKLQEPLGSFFITVNQGAYHITYELQGEYDEKRKQLLHTGSFARVMRATNVFTGDTCACKVVNLLRPSLYAQANSKKEAALSLQMRSAKHVLGSSLAAFARKADGNPNLNLLEVDNSYLFLFTEYFDGLDLSESLRSIPRNLEERLSMILQIAYGIQELYNAQIIHRDLKPANILVSNTSPPVVKIIDLGLSKPASEEITRFEGSPFYAAPEVLFRLTKWNPLVHDPSIRERLSQKHSTKTDIYSFALMLYFCITGTNLYDLNFSAGRTRLMNQGWTVPIDAFESYGLSDKSISSALTLICNDCLRLSACDRPTIEEIIAHLENLYLSLTSSLQGSQKLEQNNFT